MLYYRLQIYFVLNTMFMSRARIQTTDLEIRLAPLYSILDIQHQLRSFWPTEKRITTQRRYVNMYLRENLLRG